MIDLNSNKPFIIYIHDHCFKEDDVICIDIYYYRVVKVYKYNLWRKILNFFGIKFKLHNCLQIKQQ